MGFMGTSLGTSPGPPLGGRWPSHGSGQRPPGSRLAELLPWLPRRWLGWSEPGWLALAGLAGFGSSPAGFRLDFGWMSAGFRLDFGLISPGFRLGLGWLCIDFKRILASAGFRFDLALIY